LTKPAEAFVFSFTNSGIEWGWEGKKHFKFSQTLEMCIVEDLDGARIRGAQCSANFRWLKFGYNKININFLSGFGAAIRYADFMYSINNYIDFQPHLTALAIEPEFLFNERYSLFFRLPLLHFTYENISAYGPIRAGFISNIKIGISINFKGNRNSAPRSKQ
jgi:hypothetical protein